MIQRRRSLVNYRQQSLLFRQKREISTDKKAIARSIFSLTLLGVMVASVTLFYVWTRVEVVKLNYAIQATSKEQQRLSMQNQRFHVELATLLSPSRLQFLASKEFKLKTPKNEQIIYMSD